MTKDEVIATLQERKEFWEEELISNMQGIDRLNSDRLRGAIGAMEIAMTWIKEIENV